MASFADAEAWDARYAADAAEYDWLLDWSSLAEPILALCGPTTRVLDVGCGTSCVPARLADAGVARVVGVDVSRAAVDAMRARHAGGERSGALSFAVADATTLDGFGDGSFDVVLDKSTSDALACTPGGGDAAVGALARAAHRVLAPSGALVVVSFGTEASRLPALREAAPWASARAARLVKPALRELLPDENEAKYHRLFVLSKAAAADAAASEVRSEAACGDGRVEPDAPRSTTSQ